MYEIGSIVVYGTSGVCRITDIKKLDLTGKKMEYCILQNVYDSRTTFYVPVNEDALKRLRPVSSKEEINAMILKMNSEEQIWIDNDMKRKEEYSRIIKTADEHENIRLIKTLYLRRKSLNENGRKLRSADEHYLNLAENMLFEEFAYALDIDKTEVVDYIEKHIA